MAVHASPVLVMSKGHRPEKVSELPVVIEDEGHKKNTIRIINK